MKTVGVVSSVDMGAWRMPQKAQTSLINQYAAKEGLKIDYIVSEFVFGSAFPQLRNRAALDAVDNVIFASVFQLPARPDELKGLLGALEAFDLHFALEDLSHKRGHPSAKLVEEIACFRSSRTIADQEEALKPRKGSQTPASPGEPVKELFQQSRVRPDEVGTLEGVVRNFESFPVSTREKLENFPMWVRHRDLARFLFKADIYRSIVNVPGVIFEAGVLYGGSLATWLHLGEIYEPVNYGRRVYGFDTFTGFPEVGAKDRPAKPTYPELYRKGTYSSEQAYEQIVELFQLIDKTRKIPQIPRMRLVKGDVRKTVPEILEKDKSILIALLYLDLDLYEPTKKLIEACLPRMPKGSVICIDELCYEDWPGETQAVLDHFNVNQLTIERSPIVPNIGVIRV